MIHKILFGTPTFTLIVFEIKQMVKIALQSLAFILEVIMLGVFGYYGYQNPFWHLPATLSSVILIGLGIILWGILAAPKSKNRLKMPYLALFRGVMFLLAAFFLFQSGFKNYAVIMAFLAISTQIVSYFTES